jgi:hypothetical protein
MRLSFRALATMVIAIATAFVGAGAAAGGATTSIVIDRNETEVSGMNTCSGEEILLTGETHAVLRMTETPSGQTTVTLQGSFLIKGIGLSGQRYLMPAAGAATIGVVGDTTIVTTQAVSEQIITAGGHNDSYAHAIVHITIVDGQATAEFEQLTIHCK